MSYIQARNTLNEANNRYSIRMLTFRLMSHYRVTGTPRKMPLNIKLIKAGSVVKRHLHKKNTFGVRWLFLRGDGLYYSDSKKNQPPDHAKRIITVGATLDEHELTHIYSPKYPYYCFTIVTASRPYTFGSPDAAEARRWCDEI